MIWELLSILKDLGVLEDSGAWECPECGRHVHAESPDWLRDDWSPPPVYLVTHRAPVGRRCTGSGLRLGEQR